MSLKRRFAEYVSQNILGMLGMSAYILADTFFLSQAAGANGLTAVNMALPIYSLIDSIAITISYGSAIRFNIARAREEASADRYFTNTFFFDLLEGLIFFVIGLTASDTVLRLMGADDTIVSVGHGYMKTVLLFAPGFSLSFCISAFVRNDNDPRICMISMIISSIFNIVFDYIFMFPMHMGITGAALATGLSPILGALINSLHFFSKKNTIRIRPNLPSVRLLIHSCQLGLSSGIAEIASGITTTVYNYLTLGTAGNIGVAAYSVVANYALIATSIFNGIAQGTQPLLSEYYGKKDQNSVRSLFRMSILTSIFCAGVLMAVMLGFTDGFVSLFNAEGDTVMAGYARTGLRIYFTGYFFAGCSLVGIGLLSATEKARASFTASTLRGFVIILLSAVILTMIFGLNGVWMSFPAAEALSLVMILMIIRKSQALRGESFTVS